MATGIIDDDSMGYLLLGQLPGSQMGTLVTGPSFTREFQTADASAPHHINVTAPGSDARFHIKISPRQLNYPKGPARHGRHIVATLVEGRLVYHVDKGVLVP